MLCESREKNEATIHYAEVIDGALKKMNICEECAKKKGIGFTSSFSFVDLLGGLSDVSAVEEKEDQITCSQCELSYGEFKKKGRLGCAQCYETFKKGLEPLLEAIHKSSYHVGKVPKGIESSISNIAKLRKLKDDLKTAITSENYEKAAKIRDDIKHHEKLKTKKKTTK